MLIIGIVFREMLFLFTGLLNCVKIRVNFPATYYLSYLLVACEEPSQKLSLIMYDEIRLSGTF